MSTQLLTSQPNTIDATEARCAANDVNPAVFYSEDVTDIGTAKRLCMECPILAQCLQGAISRAEPCGVWGGQLFSNGHILALKRRRGRPPKVPRAEDQLPIVPIPPLPVRVPIAS
ncbi:MAG: WhiB family transcriptional regulator [Acidobacteria bacterium]|nr:WhiB family transcriptional regulator [Acidobacteriota bacterium]